MPNDQAHDPQVPTAGERVAQPVALSVAPVSSGGSASGSGISVSYTGTGIGETVTISTSTLNFTTKSNAAPLWYVDPGAEGTIDASPLSRTALSLAGRPFGNLDTAIKYGPNGAAKAEQVGSAPGYRTNSDTLGPSQGVLKTDVDGAGDHIRIMSRWRRNFDGLDAYAKQVEFGGTAWNIKGWRWWASVAGTKNNMVFSYGQSNTEDGGPRVTPENSASGTAYPQGTDKALWGLKKDAWVSEVIDIKQSSAPDVADGLVRMICDGQEFAYENVITQDSSVGGRYVDLVMEQWQFVYTDTPFIKWHDFIYVDDTPHALVITDKPSWGTEGAIIDPLIPIAWGSAEITAKTRCNISGKYLYLIDGNGDLLNTNGVAL
ncbi:MAG: hypothetical protein R3193_12495 [Marinobacter sp.]|nr:hypothetical protein [Marinobacter sp.]